ncbi:MAG TPA: 50S ribosomal protein L3 [Planctomycetota bacterium]|nr:50S ribosomal protein L3 [Planctomycetota bacterium]
MGHFILGRKGRMMQVFTDAGVCVPVTIVEAGPCVVTQVKSEKSRDGYNAVQLAFDPVRETRISKAEVGHCKKAGVGAHRVIREWRMNGESGLALGQKVDCGGFKVGDLVDVIGAIKGRGTAGVMKRHGFHGRPASHGHMCHRRPGSIGMHSDPGRVFVGKKMAGQYGNTRHTMKNLEVVSVDPEAGIMLIRGGVPGARGALLTIRTATTPPPKPQAVQAPAKSANPQKASAAKAGGKK